MYLRTVFLVGAFISLTDSNKLTVLEKGCEIYITWSSEKYGEFDIRITKENDSNFLFNLQTNEVNFIYHPDDTNVKYNIIWSPITRENNTRDRVRKLTLNKTAMFTECLSPITTYSSAATTPCISDFYRIYFWSSVVTIPVLIVVSTAICVYLFKNHGLKRTNKEPSSRPNLNVNSTCYNNHGANEYDQVRYSLMQDTRF